MQSCLSIQPSYITATLRPYQLIGVNWMIAAYDSGVGGILADEMGLGKTLQAITLLAFLKKVRGLAGPSLVVAPLAVFQNWANECKRFAPELSYFKIHGNTQEREALMGRCDTLYGEYDVYITTYETFKSSEQFFTERVSRWACLIIDEAHNLKSDVGRLHGALARVKAGFRLLLTGTPLQNNLHELWSLLNFLLPQLFTSSETFDASFDTNKQALNTSMVLKARMLLQHFMLRRIKSEVASLPPKFETEVICPMGPIQAKW